MGKILKLTLTFVAWWKISTVKRKVTTAISLTHSLFEDSLGLDVDKGQRARIVTTGEDEGAADNDKLQGILRVDNINFSESRSFKALLVAIQTLTPVLWNKSNLDLQLLKRIR